jgi:hypothetical protein
MPYKDPKIRTLKAKEYQAAHRLRVKQNASLVPKKVRFCAACSVNISHMRSDARFCCQNHKRKTSDAKRNLVAEYQKNKKIRRTQALVAYYADHAKSKERQRNRQKVNPAKYASAAANHRAIKLQRTPVWVGKEDLWLIKQAYELAALRTKVLGFKWHVDHVIPLQGKLVSGLHVPMNMQVIPAFDNISKHNHFEVA